ncbi:MAG: hypothetical protein ACOC2T_03505, partial [Planctomycetota bacterium]
MTDRDGPTGNEILRYCRQETVGRWRALILGAASVGIVFVLLPFSDIFTSEPRKEMQVRTVETVRMRPDPPEMKP